MKTYTKNMTLKGYATAIVGVVVAITLTLVSATPASAAYTTTSTNTSSSLNSNLTELFILEELFSDDNGDGLFSGDSNLRDLFLLEAVTGTRTGTSVRSDLGTNNLTELFILEELFSDDNGDGLFSGDSNLGELFILEELFAGGTSGILSGDTVVIVERGDTLSEIALEYYGDASLWPVIADANNLSNPNLIRIGQRLVIPDLNRGITTGGSDLTELFILMELFDDNNNSNQQPAR